MHQDRRGYYYRSKRQGARVVAEYVGKGFLAQMDANLDESERAEASQEKAVERRERARIEKMERQIDAACDVTDALMRAVLNSAGYHQHDRGQWRKRRKRQDANQSKD